MSYSKEIQEMITVMRNNGLSSRKIANALDISKSGVNEYYAKVKDNPIKPIVVNNKKKILFIPDCQVKDGIDLTYIKAIGQYIADKKPDVIVNAGDFFDFPSLSSYDKGKLSFEGRRLVNDIASGKEAMKLLLAPLRKYQEKNPAYKPRMVFTMGNHECLTSDSEVLTKSGFKQYTELTSTDEVLTLTNDLSYEWNKPDLVFEKEYNGKLHEYDSRSFSSLNTPGHRMYYLTSAGNLAIKDSKDMPENFTVCTAVNSVEKGVGLTDDEIKLGGWLCTDSYFTGTGMVVLYQRLSNSHKIRDLLDKLGINFIEKTRKRDITQICGKVLKKPPEAGVEFYLRDCETLDRIGVRSNKALPDWAKNLSDTQWDMFLDVLIDADGTIPTGGVNSRVFYGKKAICDDLQVNASLHGWTASLTEYRKTHWRVNLVKRTTRKQESIKRKEVDYNGKVWCLNVKNENFFIRRNGKCHFTGNCRLIRFVNDNPQFAGFINYEMLDLEKDWEVHEFLKPVNVQGINFVHYLSNPMSGKPYGGNALNQLKAVGASFCVGHKQTLDVAIHPVLDGSMRIGIIAGASYPHSELYKGFYGNFHFRGVVMLHEAIDGFADPSFISTDFLIRRFKNKVKHD